MTRFDQHGQPIDRRRRSDLPGITATSGALSVTASGAWIVEQKETVSALNAVTLSGMDTSGGGELILITAGSTVSSTTNNVLLSGGDDILRTVERER